MQSGAGAAVAILLAALRPAATMTQPGVTYHVVPPVPTEDEALHAADVGAQEARWAANEARIAEAQKRVAVGAVAAAQSEATALRHVQASATAAQEAKQAATRARLDSEQAEAATLRARHNIAEIPEIAAAAARRAVADVSATVITDLEADARETADEAAAAQRQEAAEASKAAAAAALPFQQAKLRAQQSIWSYATKARELATAVIPLKNKAVTIAAQSNAFQKSGNPVAAQQMQMQAHDLMDKALQLEGQAKSFQDTANHLNTDEMVNYDLAIDGAASYGAYASQPGGDRPKLPRLPKPLRLPAAAPGPAPMGAASPAA